MKYPFKEDIVQETENFIIGQDWECPIPGFLIIASKRKVDSIIDFSKEEYKEFCELVLKFRKLLKTILGIKKVYFFHSEDSGTGFHYLLFPRYSWMDKFGKKLKSVYIVKKYAEENMLTEKQIKRVKQTVKKLKKFV